MKWSYDRRSVPTELFVLKMMKNLLSFKSKYLYNSESIFASLQMRQLPFFVNPLEFLFFPTRPVKWDYCKKTESKRNGAFDQKKRKRNGAKTMLSLTIFSRSVIIISKENLKVFLDTISDSKGQKKCESIFSSTWAVK